MRTRTGIPREDILIASVAFKIRIVVPCRQDRGRGVVEEKKKCYATVYWVTDGVGDYSSW